MFPLPDYRYRILSNPDSRVKTNAKIQKIEKKVQITNFKAKKGKKNKYNMIK